MATGAIMTVGEVGFLWQVMKNRYGNLSGVMMETFRDDLESVCFEKSLGSWKSLLAHAVWI